jgi:hypothetical protein
MNVACYDMLSRMHQAHKKPICACHFRVTYNFDHIPIEIRTLTVCLRPKRSNFLMFDAKLFAPLSELETIKRRPIIGSSTTLGFP